MKAVDGGKHGMPESLSSAVLDTISSGLPNSCDIHAYVQQVVQGIKLCLCLTKKAAPDVMICLFWPDRQLFHL